MGLGRPASAAWLSSSPPSRTAEPLLFTPGPLTTSLATKQAMLVDFGSRDARFVQVVEDVQQRLLAMAGVSRDAGYECVLLQGSGTYAVEAVLGVALPRDAAAGKLLIVANGAYGERMVAMADRYGLQYDVLRFPEHAAVQPDVVSDAVRRGAFTHVAMVHHETTAGTLNPVHDVGVALADAVDHDVVYIVDSMSAFGAYDVDMARSHVSYLVSSSNKMLEGVPGFAYALCRRAHFETCAGNARSLALDLHDQWQAMRSNGQFRFTPPTHALLAFHHALLEHEAEGGTAGRLARYQRNFDVLAAGMADMGFHTYVDADAQSAIIATFLYADDAAFDFTKLYERMSDRGFVLYPGKLTAAPCFRVGCIGQLHEADITACLAAMKDVLVDMGVSLPVKQVQPPSAG